MNDGRGGNSAFQSRKSFSHVEPFDVPHGVRPSGEAPQGQVCCALTHAGPGPARLDAQHQEPVTPERLCDHVSMPRAREWLATRRQQFDWRRKETVMVHTLAVPPPGWRRFWFSSQWLPARQHRRSLAPKRMPGRCWDRAVAALKENKEEGPGDV